MPLNFHTIQRSDLFKTKESHFPFVWGMNVSIISQRLGETKVGTRNSCLAKFVDVQRLHENIK